MKCGLTYALCTFLVERTGGSIKLLVVDPPRPVGLVKGGVWRAASQPAQQGGLALVVVPDDEQAEGSVLNSTAVVGWSVTIIHVSLKHHCFHCHRLIETFISMFQWHFGPTRLCL